MGPFKLQKIIGTDPDGQPLYRCHGKWLEQGKAEDAAHYLAAQDGDLPDGAEGEYHLCAPNGQVIGSLNVRSKRQATEAAMQQYAATNPAERKANGQPT